MEGRPNIDLQLDSGDGSIFAIDAFNFLFQKHKLTQALVDKVHRKESCFTEDIGNAILCIQFMIREYMQDVLHQLSFVSEDDALLHCLGFSLQRSKMRKDDVFQLFFENLAIVAEVYLFCEVRLCMDLPISWTWTTWMIIYRKYFRNEFDVKRNWGALSQQASEKYGRIFCHIRPFVDSIQTPFDKFPFVKRIRKPWTTLNANFSETMDPYVADAISDLVNFFESKSHKHEETEENSKLKAHISQRKLQMRSKRAQCKSSSTSESSPTLKSQTEIKTLAFSPSTSQELHQGLECLKLSHDDPKKTHSTAPECKQVGAISILSIPSGTSGVPSSVKTFQGPFSLRITSEAENIPISVDEEILQISNPHSVSTEIETSDVSLHPEPEGVDNSSRNIGATSDSTSDDAREVFPSLGEDAKPSNICTEDNPPNVRDTSSRKKRSCKK